eukprot:Clim_evm22s241 gene=Clim_evmTU22s241
MVAGNPNKPTTQIYDLEYTPLHKIEGMVKKVHTYYRTGKSHDIEWRKEQLCNIVRMVKENQHKIVDAVQADMWNKAEYEILLGETLQVIANASFALDHIDAWVKPEKREGEVGNIGEGVYMQPQPKGVFCVIGAWNYPLSLILNPAIDAITAGNMIVFKPSEVSAHVSALFERLLPEYLDPYAFAVVQGAVEETTELLKHRFDHIVYTGSSAVGKIIYAKAAQFLTPVTLELGGKSPVIVAEDADIPTAANRIAWGKLVNGGQTCIAPDYVLCPKSIQSQLVTELKRAVTDFYGENPLESPDYCRIVNERQWRRLDSLLSRCPNAPAFGGERDLSARYLAPTVFADVTRDHPLMEDELFGPILPVVPVADIEEAMDFVNAGEKPLALYAFSEKDETIWHIANNTTSGGFVGHGTLVHATTPSLPFGGIGNSGIGSYHGKNGFDEFSHRRAVLIRNPGLEFVNTGLIYAPYNMENADVLPLLFRDHETGTMKTLGSMAYHGARAAGKSMGF